MKGKENKKMKEVSQNNSQKNEKRVVNSTEKTNSKEIIKHPKSGKGL